MLTVEFKVAGADLAAIEAAVEATMDNVGSLMASVTEALADQGITVPLWVLQSTQAGKPRWLTPPSNAFCSTCFTLRTLKSS